MSPNRKFEVKLGPHPPMLAIEAQDLSHAEGEALRWILSNNDSDSADYQKRQGAQPFLQGYQPPYEAKKDGWALVEFWNDDRAVIDAYVEYINTVFADRVAICEKSQR